MILLKDAEDIYATILKSIDLEQVNVCWLLFFSRQKKDIW